MNTSQRILPSHRERRTAVLIRQSTAQQVTTNQESLRLQYALTLRAQDLGWPEPLADDVVDMDLVRSGATTKGRVGFQEKVAQVALGQIGILIAYDATLLARNCSHWYQLLDLCGRANGLIADRDGVYDPSSVNGRLLLGLKGQVSELELHTIRARLTVGNRRSTSRWCSNCSRALSSIAARTFCSSATVGPARRTWPRPSVWPPVSRDTKSASSASQN